MKESKNVVAIACGGGPAPGINGVIAAVTIEAHRQGWKVLGIYEGFSHLAKGEKKYIELTDEYVSRIHLQGGSVLMMSRYNPTKSDEDMQRVVDTLTELGVTHLVTIGGDDTAFSSASVSAFAKKSGRIINVVHVPKTIDNDLPLPDGVPTFGYETARAMGAHEVSALLEDARTSNNRWYFVIGMGRTAGHLALGMAQSAAAPLVIIPEEFPQEKIRLKQLVDIITGSIVKRSVQGTNYGVAVVAEGVIEKIAEEDLKLLGDVELDEHGHIRYAELDFGKILKVTVADELKRIGLKASIVDKEVGYELRCAAPIAYDIEYVRGLGFSAVEFLASGKSGAMIALQNSQATPLYFEDMKDPATGKTKVRCVNIEAANYRIARGQMTRLEKADLDNADIAKVYGLEPQQFKARYAYLFE